MNLVTGATGHIGNVLVRELLSRGEPVRALVLPGEPCDSLDGLPIEMVVADILKPETLDRWMRGVRTVYHLAGLISIMPGDEERMYRVNVEGTRNVVHAAQKAKVKKMVHTASVHALQGKEHGKTTDEKSPLALDSYTGAYDRTKAQGAQVVLEAAKKGLDAVVVCPSGVLGPHDYRGSEMGSLIKSFATTRIHLIVNGAYDFVDVRDVAKGMILAAERGRRGEIYILSGRQVSLRRLSKETGRAVGKPSFAVAIPMKLALFASRYLQHFYRWFKKTPKFTPYSLNTVAGNSLFSRAKAETELGYRSRPLKETIRDYLSWRKNRFQKYYQQKKTRSRRRSWQADGAKNPG